jgi:hypothetical protein
MKIFSFHRQFFLHFFDHGHWDLLPQISFGRELGWRAGSEYVWLRCCWIRWSLQLSCHAHPVCPNFD